MISQSSRLRILLDIFLAYNGHWDQCLSHTNVDKSFSYFYNRLNSCVNKHAPMKLVSKRKLKQFVKPWITKGIRAPLKLKTNYMPLVMKLSINVTELAYACSLTRLSKKQY